MALNSTHTLNSFVDHANDNFVRPFEIVNICQTGSYSENKVNVYAWVLNESGERVRSVSSTRFMRYEKKSGLWVVNFRTYKIYLNACEREDCTVKDFEIVKCVPYCDKNFSVETEEKIHEAQKPATDSAAAELIKKIENHGEVRHEKYDQIKACLALDIPVYLAGPAGSGKNFTVEQICREMGWGFYFSNAVQQEFKLTGFVDANGKFHDTEFFKACTSEKECVFFLDEMDASIPEVLVLLNAAIANGYFEFPNGRVTLESVHFVAAGNTVGNGADELYTGRAVLDQATLDRFAIINFDYSRNVELGISNGNVALVDFIHDMRDQASANGIRATFSYRCISMVTELEKSAIELYQILTIAVFKGLDKDTVSTFKGSGAGKYYQAFTKMLANW